MLLSLALAASLILSPAGKVQALPGGPYVAVICSHDLLGHWDFAGMPTDYLISPNNWDELDAVLWDIGKRSQGQPIFLDYMVHGDESGLQMRWDDQMVYYDDASVGYVLNHTAKMLQGRSVVICFESCYSGRAYKYTVRGGHKHRAQDNVEDFAGVPLFPVYGTGDDHSTVGQPMYLQYLHNFRSWWVDLRVYDPLGQNKPCSPKQPEDRPGPDGTPWQKTTIEIYNILTVYRYAIR